MRYRLPSALIATAVLAWVSACDSQEGEFTRTRKVELSPEDARLGVSSAERFGYRMRDEPSGPNQELFVWRTPEDWTERPPTSMRRPNFVVRSEPQVECYVTLLDGKGNDAFGNINRWRGQMGQQPLSQDEIEALPTMPLLGHPAKLVEIEGNFGGMSGTQQNEGWMLRALYLQAPMTAISVKMIGPAEAVKAQRANFERFVSTFQLNPDLEQSQPAQKPSLVWTAPPGWNIQDQAPGGMREVTFVPEGGEGSQCYVTLLPGDAGGVKPNLDRWRSTEMGLEPLSEDAIRRLPHLDVLGRSSPLMVVRGQFTDSMRGTQIPNARLFGLICELGDWTVFVKMIGPDEELEGEQDNFEAFCRSLAQQS